MMDSEQKDKILAIVNEIDSIASRLNGLKASLERIIDAEGVTEVSVYQIRRAAILEEIYRANSIVSAQQLSDISIKWGRSPKGAAGYFSGNNPSLRAIAGSKRALTERGLEIVKENRNYFGENWLDRVDIGLVGKSNTPDDVFITL